MASADTKQGIYAWMTSVRTSMANDPCRQLFEDQVQTHAFIFLDDYMEHILAGPKQGPIIELVKTPGRKKNVPRRTRAATAAAKAKATSLSLDCDNSAKDVSIEPEAPVVPLQHCSGNSPSESTTSFPASERGAELSVIAEGDESPERSQHNAEISVPLNDSPRALAHKNSVAGFPTLPAPSPLRKSVRVAQEKLIGSALPTPVPAPVPLGKRTSWLMKAREAKAMEGTIPLPANSSATTTAFPRVPTAVKRKSGEMLDALPPAPELDKDQRKPKIPKSSEVDVVPLTSKDNGKDTGQHGFAQGKSITFSSTVAIMPVDQLEFHSMNVDEQTILPNSTEEGVIDLFKRTVEGLGARAGKSTGKSLGGAAVVALAEARAAAEAKVAERNKANSAPDDSEVLRNDDTEQDIQESKTHLDNRSPHIPAAPAESAERRLSLSDLILDNVRPNKPELSTKVVQAMDVSPRINSHDKSLSNTPHDSPPLKGCSGFVKPAGPVFNKPPPQPVFMPPASKQSPIVSGHVKDFNFPPGQFTLPTVVPLGIPARLTSPMDGLPSFVHGISQMPAKPPQYGTSSDTIFDNRDAVSTWDPSTQDIPYNIGVEPHDAQCATAVDDDDDDDDDYSWPLEDKLAASEQGWRPFDFSNVDKEDTWSSLPTESQGPTRILTTEKNGDIVTLSNGTGVETGTNDDEVQREREIAEISDNEGSVIVTSGLGEGDKAGIASLRSVEPTGSTSQASMASVATSSQPHAGFFSQATKLVNNMLGGGKKTKPELKSLQLAAAVAKKQQGEADKKVQRLKDMEARRQAAITKKAEEEKKNKEELERRKREREENTDRRPLKPPVSTKKEDDASKKRKFAPETEKKLEGKKPPSKDAVPATKPVVIPTAESATQKGAKLTALVSSTAYNATQTAPPAPPAKSAIPEAKPFKVVPPSLKGKARAQPQEDDVGDKLPSTMVQSQMAARAKAQMQAAKLPTPEVPSESIELPDINSEYSDSDDEDRVRTFDPPDWAQSPELRQALQTQSAVDPDDVFGAIRPLRMEEMFRTRHSRFRARTSSANWSGTDGLTVEEIREYARRMGYQQ